ncbi:hypothetical protein ASG11_00845 [Sphingomonas sp. Leaf357]|uniref:hypothetical protein n=1 Tax=Sphingomonas sp. Leaf357 TaxID=1736350 RepID=UPI0006FE109C|nr:hypothetical protein [Sphingomonas sp. Leaf357]KQS02997.1 hypothetical protein ASG11_00845 [Sphingomonas sp. Leaf357]
MSDSEDRYLAERAETSRRLAEAATDTAARRAHLALAERYEQRRAADRRGDDPSQEAPAADD